MLDNSWIVLVKDDESFFLENRGKDNIHQLTAISGSPAFAGRWLYFLYLLY